MEKLQLEQLQARVTILETQASGIERMLHLRVAQLERELHDARHALSVMSVNEGRLHATIANLQTALGADTVSDTDSTTVHTRKHPEKPSTHGPSKPKT